MSTRDKLRDYVNGHGIKIAFVAEHAGMTTDQLSKSLMKKRGLSADEFVNVCKVLKIPLDYFLSDEQDVG